MIDLRKIIKTIIVTAVVLAVSGAIVFVFKNKIEASAKKIQEKRSLLAVLDKKDETFLALKANSKTLEETLPVLRRALPDEDNIGGAVSSLEFLASQTNNIVSLEFEPLNNPQSSGAIRTVNFSATLAGNMDTFAAYLKGVKALPYFIEIAGVAVSSDSKISNGNSRMSIKGKLYIKN